MGGRRWSHRRPASSPPNHGMCTPHRSGTVSIYRHQSEGTEYRRWPSLPFAVGRNLRSGVWGTRNQVYWFCEMRIAEAGKSLTFFKRLYRSQRSKAAANVPRGTRAALAPPSPPTGLEFPQVQNSHGPGIPIGLEFLWAWNSHRSGIPIGLGLPQVHGPGTSMGPALLRARPLLFLA